MAEWLALPASGAAPVAIDIWVAALESVDSMPRVARDGPGVAWIEVASAGVKGYAVIEGSGVEAINFEISAPDPAAALALLQAAAARIGWELHQDDDDDDENS